MSVAPADEATPEPTVRVLASRDHGLREYRVPAEPGWTLLDALLWIRIHEDDSLFLTYSCKYNNSCKLCQARIDGRPGYLCTTPLRDGARIDPIDASRRWRDIAIQRPSVW